jgi:hypothetical protein
MKRTTQCVATVAFGNEGDAGRGEGRNEAVKVTGVDVELKWNTGANQTRGVLQLFLHEQVECGNGKVGRRQSLRERRQAPAQG